MVWSKLYKKQDKLDTYIATTHDLDGKNLFEEKFLALLVELGELANETRCFKFWSKKSASKRSIILEEFVDNIHFLLSIGLEKGYTYDGEFTPQINEVQTDTVQFNKVFNECLQFYNEQTKQNYVAMIKQYIQLAAQLGFSEQEIERAYDEKNEVNFERQEQGY